MAKKAIPFLALLAGLVDSSGSRLDSGTIEFYDVGTSTPKNVYEDRDKNTSAGSTITLDSTGGLLHGTPIFLDGLYQIIVKDSSGSTILTLDGVGEGNAEGAWIDASTYADLDTAISTIGATETDLLIAEQISQSGNVTVPSNVRLKFTEGGSINQGSNTLAINGPIEAGLWQIFDGTGTVTFAGATVTNTVYPQWWGALGNDSTDNLSAFDACIASGARDIMITEGIFQVSEDIDIDTKTNICIHGLGKASQITVTSETSPAFHLHDSSYITIRDLYLYGTVTGADSASSSGIQLENADNCIFRYNIIDNFKESGIMSNLQSAAGDGCNYCLIEGNEMMNLGYSTTRGAGVTLQKGSEYNKIINNYIHDCNAFGIHIADLGSTDTLLHNIIANNYIENIGSTANHQGIDIRCNAYHTVISGNTIKNISSAGIQFQHEGSDTAAPSYSSIVGNTIEDCDAYGIILNTGVELFGVTIQGNTLKNVGATGVGAIVSGGCDGLSMVGNTIYDSDGYGIDWNGVHGVIANNTVYDTLEHGIYIHSGAAGRGRHCIISGNHISAVGSANTQYYIYVQDETGSPDTRYINIVGNNIVGVDTATYKAKGIYVNANVTQPVEITNNTIQGVNVTASSNDFPIDDQSGYAHIANNNLDTDSTILVTNGTVTLPLYDQLKLSSASGTITATLPDGIRIGQSIMMVATNVANAITVSVTHHETSDPEVFTFDTVGDTLVLAWNGSEWITIRNWGVTV